MPIHRQDFQLLQPLVKMNKVLPRRPSDRYSNCSDDSSTCVVQFKVFSLDGVSSLGSCHPTHVVLDLGCTRSFGSRKTIRRFQTDALYSGITTGFCPCSKFFVFANSEAETCRENCLIHFPTTPPCSTIVDVLETGDVPDLFSLLQMQNLGIILELDPKGAEITCPAFGLYSSSVEYCTMGHVVLDLTSLAYQPKSLERLACPTKHVTSALSKRK